jgi:hypothetical protein
MNEEQKTISVSLKVNRRTWELFSETASERGVSKSRLFSDMVYKNCWIDQREVTEKAVTCMECFKRLSGNGDPESAKEAGKAGEELCQSLLIR